MGKPPRVAAKPDLSAALPEQSPCRLDNFRICCPYEAWTFFLAPFEERLLTFDRSAAERYGEIRADLELRGAMIGDRDCMIAAIAFANDLIVVTSNLKEFRRVKGLQVESWRTVELGA